METKYKMGPKTYPVKLENIQEKTEIMENKVKLARYKDGSLSSDNRSISPSHSDDSRSVTPPAIQQILPITQYSSNVEKPKPPQRKRGPAPKPPQQANARKESSDNPPSQISTSSETNKSET
ncbi:hypothetical protein FQA39_LY06552 [Lamprigera yunnana]|nr:hypothetical protein FQA39_LY06552 [Lamprigera yunnana]